MANLLDQYLPLTLRAKEPLSASRQAEWLSMVANGFEKLLKTIEVTPLAEGETAEISRILSGLPDPWARPLLYKYALMLQPGDQDGQTTGIYPFFKYLGEEWKALMTLLALHRDKLTVSEPVALQGSALKGLLARMLFDESDYWSAGNNGAPFLQFIRDEQGTLIGATSPFTLVFKSANYHFPARYAWYKNGTFLPQELATEEKTRLFLFIKHLKNNWAGFEGYFGQPGIRACHRKVLEFVQRWEDDLKRSSFPEEGLLGDHGRFAGPFGQVFNTSSKVGIYPGLTFTYQLGDENLLYQINASELFLPANTAVPEIHATDASRLPQAFLLHARDETGKVRYFTLPMSLTGITLFYEKLKDLLGSEWDHQLRASVKNNMLVLELSLTIDNKKQLLPPVEFTIHPDESLNRKAAIIWPNFRSEVWKSYYLYSEKLHNKPGDLNFQPLQFQKKADNSKQPPVFANGLQEGTAKLIIQTPPPLFGRKVEYEIFHSEEPFIGIEIKEKNKPAGYLILKPDALRQFQRDTTSFGNMRKARVGIDFGSNNTRVSYSVENNQPATVQFANRRVFLAGEEVHDPEARFNALPHEVFFFQNEQPNGMVKTMIMRHNEQRVIPQHRNEPGASGFPVFERNVTVTDSRADELIVDFGDVQKEAIKWNLKWQDLDTALAYKKSFLQILWLKIWAELFENEHIPTELVWAYPQVMRNQQHLLLGYESLWQEVVEKCPVPESQQLMGTKVSKITKIDDNDILTLTESEAVCMYGLGPGNINPAPDTLALGFDVGGSTTDILMIATADQEKSAQYALVKQSSVKIAANVLAEVARRSPEVQEAIRQFAHEQDIYVYGMNNISGDTADHLFNALLDRVSENRKEETLYRYLWTPTNNALKPKTKLLFGLTGYVSGLLMFYAGQMIGAEKEKMAHITQVRTGFYGNGGKMFDWLVNAKGGRVDFYQKCLQAGAALHGKTGLRLVLSQSQADHSQSRNEVSLGLAASHYLRVEMPSSHSITDIIGEEGYTWQQQEVSKDAPLQQDYLVSLQQQFQIPPAFPVLNQFLGLYLDEMQALGLVANKQVILDRVNRNDFMNYVQNHPDYIGAQRNLQQKGQEQPFNFIISPFLLEGMYVFNKILMPAYFP